ncbi:MAG: chalcone isomerase family protein [Granulosicoccus sp.]
MKFIKIKKITANCDYSPPIATNANNQIIRLLAVIFCLGSAPALKASPNPSPAPIETYISSPELVGEATLKVMLWNIFDAELYAPSGDFDSDKPFALALEYRRNFSSQSIVEETIKQIENQRLADDSAIAIWRSELESIIPDVKSGMTITGIRTHDGHTVFYNNDELSGRIKDQRFTRLFFNIWIGDKSSRPELRRKLLGYTQS